MNNADKLASGSIPASLESEQVRQPTKVGIAVECVVCGLRKVPRGRSAPLEMANSMCDYECHGYYQKPFVGCLWPGETDADFGYPCGDDGIVAFVPSSSVSTEAQNEAIK